MTDSRHTTPLESGHLTSTILTQVVVPSSGPYVPQTMCKGGLIFSRPRRRQGKSHTGEKTYPGETRPRSGQGKTDTGSKENVFGAEEFIQGVKVPR